MGLFSLPLVRRLLVIGCVGSWGLAFASPTKAGLGPENIFVVVNSASWASKTVANHYTAIRDIPPSNLFEIEWTGGLEVVDAETFRQRILGPVLTQIERRGLVGQIDAVVYSSDFPTAIDLTGDLGGQNLPDQMKPFASITGATFLWQFTVQRNPNLIGLQNNQYTRGYGKRKVDIPTHAFRSWYGWGPTGGLVEAGGAHYVISMMLAVTSGRGNSVPEAVGYLRQAARADGTAPKGTIYYCETDDNRSRARSLGFAGAVDELRELGVQGQVVRGKLPSNKSDVAGLMIGSANVNWPGANCQIVPGALCENLTSFGGVLSEGGSQTPLTEFLRYGAAGSSGTVVEPYNIQEKFPLPAVQVHYARGCSLGEAFYQAVHGPYQLLIVGDPLCQPWAKIPKVSVSGVNAKQTLSGKVNVKASANGNSCDRFELFVDGRRIAARPAGAALPLDTTKLTDGYHELRVVGLAPPPIETQGRVIIPVTVDNTQQLIEVSKVGDEASWNSKLAVTVKTPNMAGGLLMCNGVLLGKFEGAQGEIEVDPKKLGTGPVTLYPFGFTRDQPPRLPLGDPIELNITPGKALPPLKDPAAGGLVRGMRLKTKANSAGAPIQETRKADWLSKADVKSGDAFALEGFFDVTKPDGKTIESLATDVAQQEVQQFQLRYTGDIKIAVDNRVLFEGSEGKDEMVYLPIALEAGQHRLRISGTAGSPVSLQVRYGGLGTRSINGEQFRQRQ